MHSGFVISQADGRPMYLQIMDQIRRRIAVGDWPKGSEIPSIRQLAVAIGVSVITIKRAYFELEREGLIVTQHGKGSAVSDDPNLPPRIYAEELHQHLNEAVRLGTLLGLTVEELETRLRNAAARRKGEECLI
jgi:GntR family transcriptional regulator